MTPELAASIAVRERMLAALREVPEAPRGMNAYEYLGFIILRQRTLTLAIRDEARLTEGVRA